MHTLDSASKLKKARQETRACEKRIHFNNAGAALMPAPVVNYLRRYLDKEEQLGGYETQQLEHASIDNFYHATARLLNCQASEVAFAESATRAWDMAFYSLRFSPGDKILTTYSEYGSNVIAYLHQAKNLGVQLVFVPNDAHGQIDTRALEQMIDERVKLISLNHIPTGGGLVNPVMEVGRIARQNNILFLLDACQSAGQIPLDVNKIGCDMLTFPGRKFIRGPRGTGVLYVRQSLLETLEPPLIDQHAAQLHSPSEYTLRKDAKRFENWEHHIAGKAALGVAIDYALAFDIAWIKARVYTLADTLRHQLAQIPGIALSDDGLEKCAIVTFHTPRKHASEIKLGLHKYNINVSTPQGPGSLVSFQQRGLMVLVRASLHYYNTEEEIDLFINRLGVILNS